MVAGAEAALRGEADEACRQLTGAFNLLDEARKYFYPVDSYLVDLTLVAPNTLGESLAAELRGAVAVNLLLPAGLLGQMAAAHPGTFAELQAALLRGSVTLVGGEVEERELPLLPWETILAGLKAGGAEFQRLLGRTVEVFGRRRYGLSPGLPGVLQKLGFKGALHFTLDEGRFPVGAQSKVRWEADDGTSVDALARLPRDAAKSETFLDYARRLGEAMDSDHVATVVMAHWPGLVSTWYGDLRRIARYTTALGKFVTLDEYFTATYAPPLTARFLADEYRSPYLKQAIIRREADPLSRITTAHRRQAAHAAHEAVATLVELLDKRLAEPVQPNAEQSFDRLLPAFSGLLPRSNSAAVPCTLVVNPLSFARRMLVERLSTPANTTEPRAGSAACAPPELSEQRVVEVPPMGFAFVDWTMPAEAGRQREKPLAAENVLHNEFFEVTIHPECGGIQVLRDFQHRGNRLSQQIALRTPGGRATAPGEAWRDPDEDAAYSRMQADSVAVTRASSMVGEITSRGSLVDPQGRKLAGFQQRTQIWRASRILRIEIELDPLEPLRADPWNSYYAARFAWSDAAAELLRGVHGGRHPTEAKRIEAPEFIEIDAPHGRTSLLTGGLPYHRRSAPRIIDSLLVVRGETARRFSLAIGIDVANPAAAAAELLAPCTTWQEMTSPPAGPIAGWLFHLDARSVIATHWAALGPEPGETTRPPAPRGFRVRILETSGRPVHATLRAFRSLSRARKLDFRGQSLGDLTVEQDRVSVDLAAHEWTEVEACW